VLALERRWAGRDRGSLRLVNKPFLVGPNGSSAPALLVVRGFARCVRCAERLGAPVPGFWPAWRLRR